MKLKQRRMLKEENLTEIRDRHELSARKPIKHRRDPENCFKVTETAAFKNHRCEHFAVT
jgi:hypothetical protein